MGKPKLNKGAGKRARSSSEDEERNPSQQTIKSYFSKETCKLWTTVGQESKGNGKRKSLKLSTKKKEDKLNTLVTRRNDKSRSSPQSGKGKTDQTCFTKIVKQNVVLTPLPKNKQAKSNGEMSSSSSEPNQPPYAHKKNGYNNFKLPSPICQLRNKKNTSINGSKCNLAVNNVKEIVIKDDDFIPPTPSPNGQHSFISCCPESTPLLHDESRVSKILNHSSAANYYKTELSERGSAKIKKAIFVGNDPEEADDNKRLPVSDISSPPHNYVEAQMTTQATSRKKYKLSRKGFKPPRVLSSPIKKSNISASVDKSPKSQSPTGNKAGYQKESASIIAPSKCVILRSRMKRSAARGSSPMQKRLLTECPLEEKSTVKCNLWDRIEEDLLSNSPGENGENEEQQAVDHEQYHLANHWVENKNVMKQYTMDTSIGNCSLDEKLLECEELFDERNHGESYSCTNTNYGTEEMEKCDSNVEGDLKNQFRTPNKSQSHQILQPFKSPPCNNLSGQLLTPTRADGNTSVDSLADAMELDNLLDGVKWSPMVSFPETFHISSNSNSNSNSNSSSCKALFSPIRNTEQASTISKDLQNKCNITHITCHSGTKGYSRFLVLEVSRRELQGQEDVAKYGRQLPEKVLRLFDETSGQEKFCSLREDWEMSEVEPGDIVHITGSFNSSTATCILDNSTEHYLVIHPDTLVSGTTVSMATKCLRQGILNEQFRTESQSEAMLIGTLLHDLFDLAMEFKEFSPDALLTRARGLLQRLSYLDDFYSLGQTESWALEKLKEHIPLLCDWAKKFVVPFPQPDLGAMDFKTPEFPHQTEQPSVCVSALKDIEENIWSPRYGLKGKVDATVEVKIDRRPKIKRHRPDTGNQVQTRVMPLELKTGKMFTKLGSIEHRAQVILYTLLMSDRYFQAVDAGLLFYMKAAHMLSVPSFLHERRALIMKRNEVARYLTLNRAGATGSMPAMLKDHNTCKRCPQVQNCTTFHKAVEQGDGVTSGLGSLFKEMTEHMSRTYVRYFRDRYKLVCLEGKEMEQKRNQNEIWCLDGSEREKLGRCFSGMVLKSCGYDIVQGGSHYYRHKFERCADHPSVMSLQDVPITSGDRVILSEENGGATAVAAGYIHEVKKSEVVVSLDRDLTKSYDTHTKETSSKHYRLDKDEEYSTQTTLWSNMAKLFKGDSDRDAQLRRQIVDLGPPVFSRERRNDTVTMCSQTSDIAQFFSQQSPSQSNKSQKSLLDPAVESILQELNSGQRKAVSKALAAHHYALILGMPGTGKTTTISCLVRVLVASGKSVLLTSYTHTAVDNILLKLKEANIDFLRLGQIHKILPKIQSYSAHRAAAGIKTVNELRKLYESKSVVATTCLGVKHALFSQRSFDYCIVDEASQITQPVCIGPLRHARVFILVGDHYQLPPLVQSVEAREGGMDVSLFKRLSERHPHAVVSLEHQYRMNEDIMELSNTLIYEHRLKCGTQGVARAVLELPNWDEFVCYMKENTANIKGNWILDTLLPSRPVVFLDTDRVPAPESRSEHLVSNETEAAIVHQLACALLKAGLQPASLGIISPYRHQLKLITQIFHQDADTKQNEIEINTVDKYQGRDKACIIVSLVRNNEHSNVGDLLRDWRRVNVAVTRAKRKLILIGSLMTLKGSLLLQELFDLLELKDWVQVLPYDGQKMFEFLTKSFQTSPSKSLETQ